MQLIKTAKLSVRRMSCTWSDFAGIMPARRFNHYKRGQLLEIPLEILWYWVYNLHIIASIFLTLYRGLKPGQKQPRTFVVIYGWSLIKVQERHKPFNNATVMSFKHDYVYYVFYDTLCYSKNIFARWRSTFLSWAENSDILNFVEKKSMYILNIQGL